MWHRFQPIKSRAVAENESKAWGVLGASVVIQKEECIRQLQEHVFDATIKLNLNGYSEREVKCLARALHKTLKDLSPSVTPKVKLLSSKDRGEFAIEAKLAGITVEKLNPEEITHKLYDDLHEKRDVPEEGLIVFSQFLKKTIEKERGRIVNKYSQIVRETKFDINFELPLDDFTIEEADKFVTNLQEAGVKFSSFNDKLQFEDRGYPTEIMFEMDDLPSEFFVKEDEKGTPYAKVQFKGITLDELCSKEKDINFESKKAFTRASRYSLQNRPDSGLGF